MIKTNLVLHNLQGYAGIRLKDNKELTFFPGLNLLVGRNGCGKSNLIRLVQHIANGQVDIKDKIESSFPGAIEITGQTLKLKYREVYEGHNPAKFEMTGFVNFNLFSREHDNTAHAIMEGPMRDVSMFIKDKMLDFYEGSEFKQKIKELEQSINSKFAAFLGNANKSIEINCNDIRSTSRVSLSLKDNGNYIKSIDMSTGEAALLNLIFFLATAKDEQFDIISFDEPNIHMHDDMVQILVRELSELAISLPPLAVRSLH